MAWRRLGRPYPQARALTRAAHAAARAGDRGGAARRLREALPLAVALKARPLIAEIETLARRAGVTTAGPGDGAAGGRTAGELTPRETGVLRHVVQGRSNREIADELSISVKTVSVHVSNILAKLGVATRAEAAAVAHRRSLLG